MDEESPDPWIMSHPTLHGLPLQHRRSQRLLACQACISLLLTQALPAVCSCHTSYHGFCLPHDIHSSKPATLAFAPLTQTDDSCLGVRACSRAWTRVPVRSRSQHPGSYIRRDRRKHQGMREQCGRMCVEEGVRPHVREQESEISDTIG